MTEAHACKQLAQGCGSGPSDIRTRDLLDHERTLYRYTTQVTKIYYTFCIFLGVVMHNWPARDSDIAVNELVIVCRIRVR